MELGEPAGIGFSVVVEEGDKIATGGGDALVVGGAKAAVFGVADDAGGEVALGEFGRAVGGAVIDHDGLEGDAGLAREGGEAGAEQLAAVPVDYDDRDQVLMLTGG